MWLAALEGYARDRPMAVAHPFVTGDEGTVLCIDPDGELHWVYAPDLLMVKPPLSHTGVFTDFTEAIAHAREAI